MENKIKILIFAGIAVFAVINNADAQSLLWANHYNTGNSDNESGGDVHYGGDARIYVSGVKNLNSNTDAILVSYTTSGTQNWVAGYNGNGGGADIPYSVRTYGSGSTIAIYTAGKTYYNGTNGTDALLLKYNLSGTLQWAKNWNNTGSSTDIAYHMDIDGSGNIYTCGTTGTNQDDVILLKYNSSGTIQWSLVWNSTYGADRPHFVKVNSGGTYVYVAGTTNSTSNGRDVFLMKVNASTGQIVSGWPKIWNGAGNSHDEGAWLDLDASENIYIAGSTTNSGGDLDALVLKYNSSGTLQCSYTYAGSAGMNDAFVSLDAVEVGAGFELYATGYTNIIVPNTCDLNWLTVKLNSSCANAWTATYVGPGGICPNPPDAAFMVKASPTTGKPFVSGLSGETTANGGVNYTTIQYNISTGVQDWFATYNRVSGQSYADNPAGKYPREVVYNGCYAKDEVYITGTSFESGGVYNDATTIKYGYTGPCTEGPEGDGGRVMNAVTPTVTVLYPNPFSRSAVFRFGDGGTIYSNASFITYDMMGREVGRMENINAGEFEIERGDLKAGIYFYKYVYDEIVIADGKFVVSE
ncbi:MAG: T9SS type A sorting domain-containing protein [Bacteroidia bacterium]|nr:T9SS type A sorting domain-containing protein [Bacteroidia bacterium]